MSPMTPLEAYFAVLNDRPNASIRQNHESNPNTEVMTAAANGFNAAEMEPIPDVLDQRGESTHLCFRQRVNPNPRKGR